MTFRLEHIGIAVSSPIEMARWYARVLGFRIVFSAQDGEGAVAFVEDPAGHGLVEFGRLPGIAPLCDATTHPLQFHITLASSNPSADADYLIGNGAAYIEECPVKRPGEQLLLLRDPWGNSIQLAKRAN